MEYCVLLSEGAQKALKQIDRYQARMIVGWIEKNLAGCTNPRAHGKPLTGDKKGYWRYWVGSYRLIADIGDKSIQIILVHVAHWRESYHII